jgi:hypothetical protein
MLTDAQILNIKHARGASYARVQSTINTQGYTCSENGIEEVLTPDDYDIISRDNAEIQLSRRLLNIVLRQREMSLAQVLVGSTNGYSGETTFAGQITNATLTWGAGQTNANPYGDVAQAKLAVWQRIGKPATHMVISSGAYTKLIQTPQIQANVRNILGYSGARVDEAIALEISTNMLAQVFGLKKVIVGGGTYNSANEGQTASFANVWLDTYAVVYRGAPDNDALVNQDVCLGRMFVYDQANQLNLLATGQIDTLKGLIYEMYNEPKVNGDTFRAREYISQTILSLGAGQLLKGI